MTPASPPPPSAWFAVSRRRWWTFFVVAVGVRLAYWAFVTPDWVPVADSDQYVLLARSLASGHGFELLFPSVEVHPTAFRPPLYPVVLAPGFWLSSDALWPARLVTLLLGSSVVVLGAQLAERVAGRKAAWIAGGLLAVYPPLLANDTVALTEPLAMALLLLGLLALDEARWVRAALAVGLLLVTRPNGYLVVLIFAVFLWRSVGPRRTLGFVALSMLLSVGWVVRNAVQVDTARLVTSDGFTAAAIYAPQSQEPGTFVDPVFDPAFDDPDLRFSQLDEAEWNRRLMALAVEGVRENPGHIAYTVRRNLVAYLELTPGANEWAEENDGRNLDFRTATLPGFYVVTVLGLAGIGLSMHNRRLWPAAIVVGQYVVLSLLLVAPPRLRTPLDVLCCIGVGLLVHEWQRRRTGPTTASHLLPPERDESRPPVGFPP